MTMVVLFTDFGIGSPYMGQMRAAVLVNNPNAAVIDLFADAPSFNPRAAAYLLPAYVAEFPHGSAFCCVVDPGVGSDRRGAIVEVDGRWFVGPDNGLFNVLVQRASSARWWDITWRPERLSASFHGRDLFAPIAARLARGDPPPGEPRPLAERVQGDWPADLAEVVYIDHYGNVITGLRGCQLPQVTLLAGGQGLRRARTFSDVAPGCAFWYENANGLAELAVNQGRADEALGVIVGDAIGIQPIAGGSWDDAMGRS